MTAYQENTEEEENRKLQLQIARRNNEQEPNEQDLRNTAKTVKRGAQMVQTGARAGELGSKGIELGSKGLRTVSKGLQAAGEGLKTTKLGRVLAAPLALVGKTGEAAAKKGEAAGKAGSALSQKIGKGAKEVKENAQKALNNPQQIQNALEEEKRRREELQQARYRVNNQTVGAGPGLKSPLSSPLVSGNSIQNLSQTQNNSAQDLSQRQSAQQSSLRQSRAASMMQARQNASQTQQEEETTKKTEEEREEQKKKQQADMLNGSLMVFGGLTTGLDTASTGTSFLFTLILRIPILLWRNIQMIYGTHFAKGKSRFIPPISWGPIPMPADKDAILLQIKIVMADLALGIALVVVMFGGFCVVHDFTKFMTSPLQAGANLAQGGSEMCLGGIMTSMLGL